jgi:hypothetical protein
MSADSCDPYPILSSSCKLPSSGQSKVRLNLWATGKNLELQSRAESSAAGGPAAMVEQVWRVRSADGGLSRERMSAGSLPRFVPRICVREKQGAPKTQTKRQSGLLIDEWVSDDAADLVR